MMIIYFSVLILLLIFIIVSHSIYNYYSTYKKHYNCYINNNILILQLENTNKQNNKIPKIIHKIAPKDKSRWRPIWVQSHNSWLKYFPEPEYKLMMWGDDDDIFNYIKEKYNWFNSIFISYPHNIQRFDIVRYFILYEYGGIYADMDYECFQNFYDLLPSNKISIVENGNMFAGKKAFLENSLMVSPKNNNFWLDVIKLASERINRCHLTSSQYIVYSTGPNLITDVYNKNINIINILCKKLYNNKHFKNKNTDIIGMHHWTVSWMPKLPKFIKPYLKLSV